MNTSTNPPPAQREELNAAPQDTPNGTGAPVTPLTSGALHAPIDQSAPVGAAPAQEACDHEPIRAPQVSDGWVCHKCGERICGYPKCGCEEPWDCRLPNALGTSERHVKVAPAQEAAEWAIEITPEYRHSRGRWERAERMGYTNNPAEAGKFSERTAKYAEEMIPEKCKAVLHSSIGKEADAGLYDRLKSTRANMLGTADEQHYWDCHEAADTIAALQRQLAEAEEAAALNWTRFNDALRRAEAAESELQAVRRDAERYRWLRDFMDCDTWVMHALGEIAPADADDESYISPDELDVAIDAAMARKGE